jgi:hypothetical protein
MLASMTISARRKTYWALFFLALLFLAAYCVLSVGVLRKPIVPIFLLRSDAYDLFRLGSIAIPSFTLAAIGAGLPALVSVLTLSFVLASFRKTVSAEIFFFSFWIASLSFEVLRLAIYVMAARGFPDSFQVAATKVLFGARYAGTLSIFMSGVYATGLRNEKHGGNILIILAASVGLAVMMPLNTGAYLHTLELRPGYRSLNEWFFHALGIMSVLNYLGSIHVRGEKSFWLIALACAASMIGARFLASSWNPWLVGSGFILVCAGSWLFVSRLHEYYLWQ